MARAAERALDVAPGRRRDVLLTHAPSRWAPAAFWIAFAALVLVRVPSLAQPAGGDQGLYWYIGDRIAHGELPYRDAWDQKPPGIHFTYAVMMRLWPRESAVPATDLLVSVIVAMLVWQVGRRMTRAPGAGELAALLFLALGNPVVTRLGGVRVRSQCETFIALAIAAAVFVLRRRMTDGWEDERRDPAIRSYLASGAAVGIACVFKYNAGVYLAIPLSVWLLDRSEDRLKRLIALAGGVAIPIGGMGLLFYARGAVDDLYDATVSYNLLYSGETYSGPFAFVRYLFTFPYVHAWIDSLWFLGGAGCLVLIAASLRSRVLLVGPVWVAAGCLSIAINGSRGLQQYFVQAAPGLAVAAGVAGAILWARLRPVGRVVLIILVAIAVWRITDIPKGIDYTTYDWRGLTGRIPREDYLSRFGAEASDDKYAALAVERLASYLSSRTAPDDRVFVFGFSGGAYAKANRASASRFFWSRPVIVEFNRGREGYGPDGLHADLSSRRPAVVVLQWQDWQDTVDSATYFHRTAILDGWLRSNYTETDRLGNYEIWFRKP